MKKILLCFLLLPLLSMSQNATSEKPGFGKYTFGSTPSDYKDLVLEIDEGDTKLYTAQQPGEFKNVELGQVNLTFLKNKLTSVTVTTKNSGGNKFLETLKATYGQPGKSNPAKGSYEWKNGKLHLLYEKNRNGQDASASFYCIKTAK